MGNVDVNYILESQKSFPVVADNVVVDDYDQTHPQQSQGNQSASNADDNEVEDGESLSSSIDLSRSSNSIDYGSIHDDGYFYLNENFLSSDFREKSAEVASDIVAYVCRSDFLDSLPPPSKTSQIMRHLVDDLLKNREEFMFSMAQKIAGNLQGLEDLATLLDELATRMFDDGVVSWNRVVTYHAFCGYVARFARAERGFVHAEELVGEILASIVINRLGLWIVSCGGWADFDKQFPMVCVFSLGSLWKLLLFVMILSSAMFMFYKFVRQLDRSSDS